MTPAELTVIVSNAVGASSVIIGAGYIFKRWIERVDDTLQRMTDSLNSHLVEEQNTKVELKSLINIAEDVREIRDEQRRVRIELDALGLKRRKGSGAGSGAG